jgi:hypothetical protein
MPQILAIGPGRCDVFAANIFVKTCLPTRAVVALAFVPTHGGEATG